MSFGSGKKALECRCTRCRYNNNGQCGFQGRVMIDANGECGSKEEGFGGDPGPY